MINSNVVFTFLFGGKRGWIMIFVSWKNSKTYQVSSWIIDEWIYGKGQPPFFINLMQLLWGAQDEGDVNRTSVQTLIGCDCGVRTLLAVGKVRFLQTLCNLPLSLYVWQNCNENEQLSKTSLVILIDFLSENRLKLKKVRIYKAVNEMKPKQAGDSWLCLWFWDVSQAALSGNTGERRRQGATVWSAQFLPL